MNTMQFTLNGKEFDANTEFNANVMIVNVESKLKPGGVEIYKMLNASELKKRGIDVFYGERSLSVDP